MDAADQYWMVGGDGAEYGPHPLSTLQGWVQEGRVAPDTRIRTGPDRPWLPAAQVPGLRWPSGPGTPSASAAQPSTEHRPVPVPGQLAAAVRSHGNWFYWIAGLSAVNIGLILTGSGFGFAVSTTVTDIIGHLASRMESGGRVVALLLDGVVLGGLCLLGWLAGRGSVVAFGLGLVLYALDGLLAAYFRQWISAAFHGYVVWQLFQGLKLARWMRAGG